MKSFISLVMFYVCVYACGMYVLRKTHTILIVLASILGKANTILVAKKEIQKEACTSSVGSIR